MAAQSRIDKFRNALAKEIPIFPNKKPVRQELIDMKLQDLLVAYMAWRLRFVRAAKRTIVTEQSATNDMRWKKQKSGIDFLLQKVQRGEDLTPHLSRRAITKGYTPKNCSANNKRPVCWEDKDYLLNVTSCHHFHLGTTIEKAGHVTPTNDVLFAVVSRDLFRIVGIFNHEVFDDETTDTMPSERERLWKLHDSIIHEGIPAGTIFSGGGFGNKGMMMDGTPYAIVSNAIDYRKKIEEIDRKMDDISFLTQAIPGITIPSKAKFRWHMNILDLGVLETTSQQFFIFRKGPN